MYLAAVEHRIRRGVAAIDRVAEELAGFFFGTPDYERGVSPAHAAARRAVMDRAEQQRCEFVEREAEEEVAEPSWASDVSWHPLTRETIEDAYWCYEHGVIRSFCKDNPHQSSAHAGADTASAGTPAAEAPSPAGVDNPPSTPAGLPTDPSPTIASRLPSRSVRGEGSPADCDIPQSPAGERPNFAGWATPAICDVLAGHDAYDFAGFVECRHPRGHQQFPNWQAWREHVSPLIAARLEQVQR